MTGMLPWLRSFSFGLDRDWVPKLYLAALMALAGCVRWIAFRGFIGSDDRVYADLAHALASGDYPLTDFSGQAAVFPNRIGLIAPVAAAIRVLGTGELAFLLYPFAVSMASIALAFWFGRALFGTAAGLLAAAMIALLPIELSMATHLVPDLAATFWANLGVFAVWRATRGETPRRALALGLAAGTCFGIAWLHKVSIAYVAPFIAGALLVAVWRERRTGSAAGIGVAGAALAILLAECLAYSQLTGDALHRFSSLTRNFEQTATFWFVEGGRFGWAPGHYAEALASRLFVIGPSSIFLSRAYAHLPLAALLVGALAIRQRDQRHLFCGLWFASLLLLFNFGTTSLDYYKPLILFQRYLYPLVLPAVLLVCGWLVSLRRGGLPSWRLPVPRLVMALIVCLPIARGYVAGLDREFERPLANQSVRSAAVLLDPAVPTVTDASSLHDLRFFWGYPEASRLRAFGNDVAEIAPGSLVFINRERIRLDHEVSDQTPPGFWNDLPADWELLHRVSEGEIYRVPGSPAATPLQLGRR